MAEPKVHVHAKDLKGDTPVAVRDGVDRYDLAIDFSWPAEDIVKGLEAVFRDGVDSGRWSRTEHDRAHEEQSNEGQSEAAPHPEDGS